MRDPRWLRRVVTKPARSGREARALGADALGGHAVDPRRVRRWRRAGRETDDPMTQHAVGDAERAVERLQHLARGVELEQVVVGIAAVFDLVRKRPDAPLLIGDDGAVGLDDVACGIADRGAALVLERRVDQGEEVVERCGLGHVTAVDYSGRGANPARVRPTTGMETDPEDPGLRARVRW